MVAFTESFEEKARHIAKDVDVHDWDNSLPAVLKRNIALTLNQIDRLREFHDKHRTQFLETECDLGTELMQMEARTPPYSPMRFPEREKLNRSLIGIKNEQRKHNVIYEDKLQNLQKTLLKLLHEYEQIKTMNHEHRQNHPKARTGNAPAS